MCQISLVDCGSEAFNKLLMYVLSTENSKVSHKDGFGFLDSNGKVYKVGMAASDITNFGKDVLRPSSLKGRCLFHVRLASQGYNRFITDAKAHPFESKDLILVHNGTLYHTGKEVLPYDNIDSENFLLLLQKEYTKCKNVPEAAKKAYESFSGKFAFIIYEKSTKNFYILRGNATLFKCDFKITDNKTGKVINAIVINTDRADLLKALHTFINLMELLWDVSVDIKINDINLIPNDSIFLLHDDNTLEKIGSIVEKVYVAPVVQTPVYTYGNSPEINSTYKRIIKFAEAFNIDVWELDKLIFVIIQKPLITCTKDDLEDFSNLLITPVFANQKDLLNKHRTELWLRTLKKFDYNRELIYSKIQFPWFMNKTSALETLQKGAK
jgi:predicted glutamine amidotransferase